MRRATHTLALGPRRRWRDERAFALVCREIAAPRDKRTFHLSLLIYTDEPEAPASPATLDVGEVCSPVRMALRALSTRNSCSSLSVCFLTGVRGELMPSEERSTQTLTHSHTHRFTNLPTVSIRTVKAHRIAGIHVPSASLAKVLFQCSAWRKRRQIYALFHAGTITTKHTHTQFVENGIHFELHCR